MFACLYQPSQSNTVRLGSDNALVDFAYEYSPRVEVHGRDLVVLDVSGGKHLWGSAHALGEQLGRVAIDRNLVICIAIASTRMAALLMTQDRCGLTVIPPKTEMKALSPLPLAVITRLWQVQSSSANMANCKRGQLRTASTLAAQSLPYVEPVIALLPVVKRWGITTLGDLAALPTHELFNRLGRAGLALQQIARGEDRQPLVPALEKERFEETMTLEWPIEGLEALSFVLEQVLGKLCQHLDASGMAVSMLRMQLTVVSRDIHERTFRFPVALNTPKVLRTLILLDLETHPPASSVDRVTVIATPVPTGALQPSLLDRTVPPAENFTTLLARLEGLMGDQRCGTPVLMNTHQPGVFEMQSFNPKGYFSPLNQTRVGAGLVPVFRRFRQPIAIRVVIEHGVPVRVVIPYPCSINGEVVTHAGPWRSSGHWWMSSCAVWDRDEWDVEVNGCGVYRIFLERKSDCWFAEGVID